MKTLFQRVASAVTAFRQPTKQAVENKAITQAVANFGYVPPPPDQYGIPLYMPVYLSQQHATALEAITTRSRISPITGGLG